MRSRRTARDKIIWVALSWNYVESICRLDYFILKEILKEGDCLLSNSLFEIESKLLLFCRMKLYLRLRNNKILEFIVRL